jgi:hypothetical protein
MNDSMVLKELHDEMLANAPSGVEHDTTACPLCAVEDTDPDTPTEEVSMSKEYSQDEFDAAVALAVKPLEDKIKELLTSQEQAQVEERIAKEKAELEAKIAEIQSQLDSAVLEAAEAKKAHDEMIAFFESAKEEEARAAELAARKEERLTVVREVASFPEEYVEANAERWASLSDEDFEALTNDWKAIAAKREESSSDSSLPNATAMVASRQDGKPSSALKEIFELTLAGFDPKTL